MLKIKKARLIEHNMTYEDLMLCKNFSDDEQTLEYNNTMVGDIKTIKSLKKANKLKN